jgi:uncharacterized hydrophobic protein (TIGR00271 family)
MNSSPAVIGGMIISPLMWPLMKIAIGISYNKKSYLKEALTLLFFSIVLTLGSSFFIAMLSPIKLINDEILLRTNPNFIDLIIALGGGSVAALGMIQPRISESLAGVAIATALMPPVCVSAIGLALGNYEISLGGFILFAANVIAIIFISTLIFTIVGIKREGEPVFKSRGVIFITCMLILTAIPLFFFMRNYAFRNVAYDRVQAALVDNLEEISPSIAVDNIQTKFVKKNNQEIVDVEADVRLPNDLSLNYQQQQILKNDLEDVLEKPVDLKLNLSPTISIITEEDIQKQDFKTQLKDTIVDEIEKIDDSFSIETLEITNLEEQNKEGWQASLVLYSDPSVVFTAKQKHDLESLIADNYGQKVNIDVKIIPIVQLKTEDDIESQELRKRIESTVKQAFSGLGEEVEVSSVEIEEVSTEINDDSNQINVRVEIKIPNAEDLKQTDLNFIKNILNNEFKDKKIRLYLTLIEKQTLNF